MPSRSRAWPRRTKRNSGALVLAALALLPLAGIGCGGTPPERPLLTRFFHASRLYDRTALAGIATVSLNPRTDGIVEQFDIVSVGPDERRQDVVRKQVTVNAQLRTPEGPVLPRTLVFTFERRAGDTNWMIIEWRSAATRPRASRTSPAASSAPPY